MREDADITWGLEWRWRYIATNGNFG